MTMRTIALAAVVVAFSAFMTSSAVDQRAPGAGTPPVADPVGAPEWFVSATGAATNDGTADRPLDLATALSAQSPAMPGDTVWLRGGLYQGSFTSELTGTPGAPIVVRAVPGERVTIDGAGARANTLTVRGAHVWFWGFEVTNSDDTRVYNRAVAVDHPEGPDQVRGVAINVFGPHTRFVNLIVHDALGGFGLWESAVDTEVYGCLTYNNGVVDTIRGHGHGLYIQNRLGTKRIVDVIAFGNHATGMKVYGESGYGIGVEFDGVLSFNNGVASASGGPRHKMENLFVGTTDYPADAITVRNSAFYHAPGVLAPNVTAGYQNADNGSLVLRDNFIIGGSVALTTRHWHAAEVTGNTLYAETSDNPNSDQSLAQTQRPDGSDYLWDDNRYFDGTRQAAPFVYNGATNRAGGGNLRWQDWRAATGFDGASTYTTRRPSGATVLIRPNRYEPGRANLAIYNWDGAASVPVDLGETGLMPGDRFEIRDAQNYFGRPVWIGSYAGTPIDLPLLGLIAAAATGSPLFPAVHTAPEFAVFVVLRSAEAK